MGTNKRQVKDPLFNPQTCNNISSKEDILWQCRIIQMLWAETDYLDVRIHSLSVFY